MLAVVSFMVIGNLVIYLFGILWLGVVLGWDKPLLEWGVLPFLWGDFLKITLAAVTMPIAWKLILKR